MYFSGDGRCEGLGRFGSEWDSYQSTYVENVVGCQASSRRNAVQDQRSPQISSITALIRGDESDHSNFES